MSKQFMAAICLTGFALSGFAASSNTINKANQTVAATISHTTRVWSSSGILQTFEFKEKMVRQGNTIWIERVIPQQADILEAQQHNAEQAGHKHLDKERAAKWITLNSDGSITLRLVDPENKAVVTVSKAEFSTVRFDGRWQTAYHLVSPDFLKTLTLKKVSKSGVQELVKEDGLQQTAIQWDTLTELPLEMVYQDKDGVRFQKSSITLNSPPSTLPWKNLAGYKQMELSDFLD